MNNAASVRPPRSFLVIAPTSAAMIIAALAGASEANHPAALIMLEAKPAPVAIHPAQAAVLVVDMQNDFGAKGGMFDLAGIDITEIQKAVAPTAQVIAAARRAGIKIVYLKMAFLPDLSDLGAPDSRNRIGHLRMGVGENVCAPDGRKSRILVRDTWNTDILPELAPESGDIVIYKHRFSGFFETELDRTLRELGINQLIVTGCTTSVCVESTIRDAMFRDYACVLLADCTAEPIGAGLPRTNYEASLLVIRTVLGSISNSQEFLRSAANQMPSSP